MSSVSPRDAAHCLGSALICGRLSWRPLLFQYARDVAICTKRTNRRRRSLSAFGGKADIAKDAAKPAFDPKRTNNAHWNLFMSCALGLRDLPGGTILDDSKALTSSARHSRLGHRYLVFFLCACFAMTIITEAQSRQLQTKQSPASDRSHIDRGAYLFHGNYCGLGNRPGTRPVDALDAACMRHDSCVPSEGLPSCACNVRLQQEAAAVASDPAQSPDIQFLASVTAAGAALLLCQRFI